MGIRSRRWLTVAGIALLGTVTAVVVWRGKRAEPRSVPTVEPQPSESAEPIGSLRRPASARSTAPSAEASLMAKLHELGETDPPRSLELAIQGNRLYPESKDAPERGWIICKSLVNMQRFEEAQAEARIMVERYPNTPWTLDVERHLLVNPLTHPSERGYGKKYELE
jgi:hypothetical protein